MDLNCRPYSYYYELMDFDLNRNPALHVPGYALKVKLFIVSMIFYYKKVGLDSLVDSLKLLNIVNINDEDDIDIFYHMDTLCNNGIKIQNCITSLDWEYEAAYLTSNSLLELSTQQRTSLIDSLFTQPEQSHMSGLLDLFNNVECDSDFYLSIYKSKKVGKVLNYFDLKLTWKYPPYDTIMELLQMLNWPFAGAGHSSSFRIDDTYYIAFIEGYSDEFFDYAPHSMDLCYPLYALSLNYYIEQAYKDLPIDDFYKNDSIGGNTHD